MATGYGLDICEKILFRAPGQGVIPGLYHARAVTSCVWVLAVQEPRLGKRALPQDKRQSWLCLLSYRQHSLAVHDYLRGLCSLACSKTGSGRRLRHHASKVDFPPPSCGRKTKELQVENAVSLAVQHAVTGDSVHPWVPTRFLLGESACRITAGTDR